MGPTSLTADQVEEIARQLGSSEYRRSSYNRLQHNCVDFAQDLCARMQVSGEFPAWCHRGSSTVRQLGLTGPTSSISVQTKGCVPDAKEKPSFSPKSTRVPQRQRADSTLSSYSVGSELDDASMPVEPSPIDRGTARIA